MGASPMGPQEIPDEELRTGFWCAIDMNVQVRRTFSNENLFGIEGTIRSVKVILKKNFTKPKCFAGRRMRCLLRRFGPRTQNPRRTSAASEASRT